MILVVLCSIHPTAISTLGDFACTICVLSLTEKVSSPRSHISIHPFVPLQLEKSRGIRASPSALILQLHKEPRGRLSTSVSFDMREIVSLLYKCPFNVLQQTLECKIIDARRNVVAIVSVKFSFRVSKRVLKQLGRKASVCQLSENFE